MFSQRVFPIQQYRFITLMVPKAGLLPTRFKQGKIADFVNEIFISSLFLIFFIFYLKKLPLFNIGI
ncbi:TPA: hypothetical protein ACISXX_004573, partial [Salmonella enterica subsp. diarizonae serovar 61:l,v:z35]